MKENTIIKPSDHFHAGTESRDFERYTLERMGGSGPSVKYTLDLSDVIYMDTMTFRIVFNLMPQFETIIPPESKMVIERYDLWLDFKKGLKK